MKYRVQHINKRFLGKNMEKIKGTIKHIIN